MKRTVRIIFVLAVCLLALAPSTLASPVPATSAQAPAADGTITVKGTIRTSPPHGSVPLANTWVSVSSSPGGEIGKYHTVQTVTDSNGYYEVELPYEDGDPSHKGYIKLRHKAFPASEKWVNGWEEGETYTYNFTKTPVGGTRPAWVGLRNSYYGATDPDLPETPDKFPYPFNEEWGDAAQEVKARIENHHPFPTSFGDPTLLLVVGEVDTNDPDDGGIIFWFDKPSGAPTDHIQYVTQTGLDIESLLDYCDSNSIKVYLQVESGYADVPTLIEVVMDNVAMNNGGDELHPSVVGFGVDLEYYNDSNVTCNDDPDTCGEQVGNTDAAAWEMQVKAYSPDLQLLLKHFGRIDAYPDGWNKFPPDYRGDIIFVNDSQGFEPEDGLTKFEVCLKEMKMFSEYYAHNDVIFQQGYEPDAEWWDDWSDPVGRYGYELLSSRNGMGYPGQKLGFLWVDFTMHEVLDSFGDPETPWRAGRHYGLGDVVTYGGSTWECVYAHDSQSDWYPGARGLWFWSQVPDGNEWVTGKAYTVGDVVTYGGSTWECTFAHTSQVDWYPGAPGLWFWQEQ